MLLLAGGLAGWREHTTLALALGAPGAVLVLGALLAPSRLTWIERRWMAFALVLGAFNTRLILTLCYYLVITPVGVIMRAVRSDPLDRHLRAGDSYWRRRPPEAPASVERYMRQS